MHLVQVVNVATALICVGTLVLLRGLGKVQWHGLWFLKMKAGFLARFCIIRSRSARSRAKRRRRAT